MVKCKRASTSQCSTSYVRSSPPHRLITLLPRSVSLKSETSAPSLPLTDPADAYLRRLILSPDFCQLLTTSTEGAYALHEYPSLAPAFHPTADFKGEEIVDADFSPEGTQVVVCTGHKLKILGTFPNPGESAASQDEDASPSSDNQAGSVSSAEAALLANAEAGIGPKGALNDIDGTKAVQDNARHLGTPPVWQTIQNPALGGEGGCEFRAVKFGRARRIGVRDQTRGREALTEAKKIKRDADTFGGTKEDATKAVGSPAAHSAATQGSAGKLFTIVNAKAGGKTKGAKRKSFLTAWSLSSWELIETRQLAEKPVTACDISPCGRYLAYGSSDLSIGVVNARNLRPVFRILDAHSFPATALSFSPDGRWLVSASADNTLRVVKMPGSALDDVELGSSGSMGLAMMSLAEHKWLLTLVLTLFILVLALYIQRNLLPSM